MDRSQDDSLSVAGALNDDSPLDAVLYNSFGAFQPQQMRRFVKRHGERFAHNLTSFHSPPSARRSPHRAQPMPGDVAGGSGQVVKVQGAGKSRALGERHNLLREAARGGLTISFVKLNADSPHAKILCGA